MKKNQKLEINSQMCNVKVKSYFLILICTFTFYFLPFNFALAAEVKPPPIPCPGTLPCITEETQKDPSKVREHVTVKFASRFLTGFLGIAAVTSVIFIIVGGLQLHLAMGNEEAMTKAKKTLLWAIVGLVISILAVAIVRIVTTLPFQPPPPS